MITGRMRGTALLVAVATGSVDPVRLQRVVDVMQRFLGFDPSFNINSMLLGG